MLSIENLSVSIGRSFQIDSLSLEVDKGERLSVLGPNGSGKSSLIRTIAGLEVPLSGRMSWSGLELSIGRHIRVPPEGRGIGILFQEGALFPHLDVRKNVEVGIFKGTSQAERNHSIDRALELTNIRHLDTRSVTTLSGGEQQRVALARALVRKPQLLLLDEPFHSLDGPVKREVLTELKAIVEEEKMAALHVTHDVEEAAMFSDRIVLIRDGKKVQEGTFEELYSRPVDEFVGSFLGDMESIEVESARSNDIALPEDVREEKLFFRPEHLRVSVIEGGDEVGLEVCEVRRLGALQNMTVLLNDGTKLSALSLSDASLHPGQRVSAHIVESIVWSTMKEPVV